MNGQVAKLVDVQHHIRVAVAKDLHAEPACAIGELGLSSAAAPERQVVHPGWAHRIGDRRTVRRCTDDGDATGLTDVNQIAGSDIVVDLDAKLAGAGGEGFLRKSSAGKLEAVQPLGRLAVCDAFFGLGVDGNLTMLGDIYEISRLVVAKNVDAEFGGIAPF